MRHAIAAVLLLATAGAVMAQQVPSITVRPPQDGGTGDGGYVGPYGRNLPGVSMFAGRAAPATPTLAYGGVALPTRQKIEDELIYSQSELPVLDAWHGTLSPGIPF